MATNKKPTHTFRCGNIKATIWQNVSEKGPFFARLFPGHSRITLAHGATAPPSVPMTSRRC